MIELGHNFMKIVFEQPENVAAHFFWIALPVMLSTAFGQMLIYLTNKRRGEKKDKERAIQEAEKEERSKVLLDNFPLHAHGEWKGENSEGPLHAENIHYPRTSGR